MPTYELAQGPAAVSFPDYASEAIGAWHSLLSEDPAESAVQRFLEDHPALVPGSRSPGAATSCSPLRNIAITQPRLPGLDARLPDYLWLTSTSDTWYPVLIEIERPSKQIFRKDGVPSADFTQARNQLNQWRTWFGRPANRLKFEEDYGIPDSWTCGRTISLYMILVYGRRCEFENEQSLSTQRASLLVGNDEELMSFDRLTPDRHLDDAVTCRAVGHGRYRALKVPPTFTLDPLNAERLLRINNMNEAIDSSEGWAPDRRSFVKQRLPYWVEWAKRDDKGFITVGDHE